MKKWKICGIMTAAVLAITAAVPLTAYAAGNTCVTSGTGYRGGWQIFSGNFECRNETFFPVFSENCFPSVGWPGENLPETDTSEQDTPETEKPGDGAQTDELAVQVLELVNEERQKAGLGKLALDAEASEAARVRAEEISTLFSHVRPDGSSFSTALEEAGADFRFSGENIAYGQRSAGEVMEGWMNSSGHRANILGRNYENIGIGCYRDASGTLYWVQLFTD